MRVYIVYSEYLLDYTDNINVAAIFSKEKDAEEYCTKQTNTRFNYYYESIIVDEELN